MLEVSVSDVEHHHDCRVDRQATEPARPNCRTTTRSMAKAIKKAKRPQAKPFSSQTSTSNPRESYMPSFQLNRLHKGCDRASTLSTRHKQPQQTSLWWRSYTLTTGQVISRDCARVKTPRRGLAQAYPELVGTVATIGKYRGTLKASMPLSLMGPKQPPDPRCRHARVWKLSNLSCTTTCPPTAPLS